MSATAMLEEGGADDLEDALSGHVCRCGSYDQIMRAVARVASATGD
jgi:aerobic-type carbon monoxide dehydrogenase small subunit (CoxS/CutS family)